MCVIAHGQLMLFPMPTCDVTLICILNTLYCVYETTWFAVKVCVLESLRVPRMSIYYLKSITSFKSI